ncbi:MAG TPA: sigma 54-interacting transcriptional regulator [Polyangiales bacterium]|nr:sigma 54-interacting transcriptional regulator [Polyangiales bacterium]
MDNERYGELEPRAEEILLAAGEGIYGLDLRGQVTFVNPAAAALTGHTRDELLGQPMHEVVHHSRGDGRRLMREQCAIHAAIRDGEVHHSDCDVFWRKDGSCFPVEFRSTPVVRDGVRAGAVVVFQDITARKRNERALKSALDELSKHKDALVARTLYLEAEIDQAHNFGELLGQGAAMRELSALLMQIAPTDSTVLIQGESGTGKELVARAIHRLSRRNEGPLVTLNCGAIPLGLVESELFGHERGAFTGASQRRLGRFELAHGGTLFLDEVGELPLAAQAKLLRVLQERTFERVGGTQRISADVRVLAATNRDLRELVASGAFRLDLFYRLDVLPLITPPLRERKEDIPLLAAAFLRTMAQRLSRELHGLSHEGLEALMAYDWPGNVRELENVIERSAILAHGPLVNVHGLSPMPPKLPELDTDVTLEEQQRALILRALEQSGWKLAGDTGAGARLGLHPNTLRSRMRRLGLARTR